MNYLIQCIIVVSFNIKIRNLSPQIIVTLMLLSLIINFFMLIMEYLIIILLKKIYKIMNDMMELNLNIMPHEQINCCICLEEIIVGIQLNCRHILHNDCYNNLLNAGFIRCPLCMKPYI